MSIRPDVVYPGQVLTGDPGYPYGKARNITVPGDGTGTPLEQQMLNDVFGFEQQLLAEAGIVPSGVPDAVGASDYERAVSMIAKHAAHRIAMAGHSAFNPSASGMAVLGACPGMAGSTPIILVVGSLSGSAHILYTTGEAWVSLSVGVLGSQMKDVIHTGTRWVAVGINAIGYAAAATPSTWTSVTLPSPIGGGSFVFTSICKHGSRLVTVGYDGTSQSDILTSDDDGSTWTPRAPANGTDILIGVASNGTRLVAVGTNSGITGPIIWTSDDGGVTWVTRTPGTGSVGTSLRKLIWNGYLFVAVGDNEIHISRDGIAWTRIAPPIVAIYNGVVWTGALLLAYGTGGTLITSRINAKTWTKVNQRDVGATDIFAGTYSPELNMAIIPVTGTVARRSLCT